GVGRGGLHGPQPRRRAGAAHAPDRSRGRRAAGWGWGAGPRGPAPWLSAGPPPARGADPPSPPPSVPPAPGGRWRRPGPWAARLPAALTPRLPLPSPQARLQHAALPTGLPPTPIPGQHPHPLPYPSPPPPLNPLIPPPQPARRGSHTGERGPGGNQ